jgi:hypothetical protein
MHPEDRTNAKVAGIQTEAILASQWLPVDQVMDNLSDSNASEVLILVSFNHHCCPAPLLLIWHLRKRASGMSACQPRSQPCQQLMIKRSQIYSRMLTVAAVPPACAAIKKALTKAVFSPKDSEGAVWRTDAPVGEAVNPGSIPQHFSRSADPIAGDGDVVVTNHRGHKARVT